MKGKQSQNEKEKIVEIGEEVAVFIESIDPIPLETMIAALECGGASRL